jgi:hypothetical protein
VALVTCAEYPAGSPDDRSLLAPLARSDVDATFAVWDDPVVAWLDYDLVVLRSTWDYPPRRDDFVAWAASVPRLANPLPAVRWSSDKTYLRELAAAGAPCVPTHFVDPHASAYAVLATLADVAATAAEIVVKPSVGAGSVDAARFDARDPAVLEVAVKHATALVESGRTALVQPYLDGVDGAGECALVYVDGVFSHAIRKEALLSGGPTEVAGLFLEERTSPVTPSPDQLAAAEAVLAAAPFRADELLYARVDLLPGPDGRPLLLELELVEPSLFFDGASGAVDRFAAAIARRCGG